MDHAHERPSVEPTPPKRPNPIIEALEHMTPEADEAMRYLAERDSETANDPDPDALPSLPDSK